MSELVQLTRGGPMWYADSLGVRRVYDRTLEFHAAEVFRFDAGTGPERVASCGD